MKVTFELNANPLTIDASAEEIGKALDKAIRSNEDFYKIATDVVGTYLAERVRAEGRKQGLFTPETPKTGKYSTRAHNLVKRAKNGTN